MERVREEVGKFSLVEPGIKGRTDEGANGFGGWYRMSQK